MNRALIVFNPVAGSTGAGNVASKAEARLRADGWHVEAIPTHDRNGAAQIVRNLASEIDMLVIAGGDGSLREAMEGLGEARARVQVGFLPLGNANVAAQELGIPPDPDAAIENLVSGEPRAIDLGRLHTDTGSPLFLAMVGIGWDAITVRYIDRVRHTPIGRRCYRLWADAVYVVCGVLAMMHIRPPRFTVSSGDMQFSEQFCAMHVCNFRSYGKGMSMTPEADADSGVFHYQARKMSVLPALIWHLIAAQRKVRLPQAISEYGTGEHFNVQANKPLPVQIDGDFVGEFADLSVEILVREASIMVPKNSN